MARQKEYQGTAATTIRGGYVPFMLNRDSHLDVYQNAVGAINEQHEKALEARGKIEAAINQIDLAPEESKWKQNYLNNVLKKIDDEARYGSYSTALGTATKLAQTAGTDPALLGRAKYYQKFKEWNKELDNRTDIDETTKQWARTRPENKYNYKPVFADDGVTEVEGEAFTNTRTPLADIKWEKEALDVFRLLNPSRRDTESSSTSYVDGTGGGSSSKSSLEKISPEEVDAAMNKWYDSHREQVYQDWEIFNWTIDQKRKALDNPNLSASEREIIQQELAESVAIQEKFGSDNLKDYAQYQLSKYKNELSYTRSATGSTKDSRVVTKEDGGSSSSSSGAGGSSYAPSNYGAGRGRVTQGNRTQIVPSRTQIGFEVSTDVRNGLSMQ